MMAVCAHRESPAVLLSLAARQIRYRLPPPVLRYPLTSPFREMPTESTCPNASRFVTSYLTAYAIGKTGLVVLHTGRGNAFSCFDPGLLFVRVSPVGRGLP